MEQLIFLVNKFGQCAQVCIARMENASIDDAMHYGQRNIEHWKRMYPSAHTFTVVASDMPVAPPPV